MKARKQASHPAKINLRNAFAVVQSWFRARKIKVAGLELPEHIYEQYIWRIGQVVTHSPKCWKMGSCKVCGCSILEKLLENRGCSIAEHPDLLEKRQPCYPDMMCEMTWETFKKIHNIKLFN